MASKSIFVKPNTDFHMLNQTNNFEDACSPDDIEFFVHPGSRPLPKVSSWHSLLSSSEPIGSQTLSADASPNSTPQSSPSFNRKQFDMTKMTITPDQINTKRWFNSHLFTPFSDATLANASNQCDNQSNLNKSKSCKNVSNSDINAVGPISF